MIDLYGLPSGFPGLAAQSAALPAEKPATLEGFLKYDISRRLGGLPVDQRLIPYIQIHEFEALLFVDPAAFLEAFPHGMRAVKTLTAVRAKFANPEDINDGQQTAPSKRILSVLPDYQKPVAGLLIAQRIGLAAMCAACPHFDSWVTRLLGLAAIA